jgi:hypothetical protein
MVGEAGDEVTDEDLEADQELLSSLASTKTDSALAYVMVAKIAKNAGLPCSGERIAIATAVAKAESDFRPDATNTVGNAHGTDRGLWQINSYWHPDVSATCAFSASCNARAMVRISDTGTDWSPWRTYKNGTHLPFMTQARGAQASVCQ